jgi:hypothetical protein
LPDELLQEVSPRSIITLAEANAYLKRSAAKTDEQAILCTFIDHVSGVIEDMTGRKVKVQAVEEVTDGSGGCAQAVCWFPVARMQGAAEGSDDEKRGPHVSSIQYRGADGTGEWQNLLTDISSVFLSTDPREWWKIELLGGAYFPRGRRNIRLRYWAGWADPPQELKQVALEMLFAMYEESHQGNQALMKTAKSASIAGGSGSITYTDLRPRWKETLSRYTIRRP